MVRKAWFDKDNKLNIICPHCETINIIDDIPGDDFDAYKCYDGCKKTFYAKSVLRIIVRKLNEDLFENDVG